MNAPAQLTLNADQIDDLRGLLTDNCDKDSHTYRELHALCDMAMEAAGRSAELEGRSLMSDAGQSASAPPQQEWTLPSLDKELEWILGRPSFACTGIFRTLRKGGKVIPTYAEEEQAASIYWMLGLYFKHGPDKWRDEGEKELKAIHESTLPPAGEKS